MNVDRGGRQAARPMDTSRGNSAIVLLVGFLLFCAWDYSPYGYGYAAASLAAGQRAVQGFMSGNFRVRL